MPVMFAAYLSSILDFSSLNLLQIYNVVNNIIIY